MRIIIQLIFLCCLFCCLTHKSVSDLDEYNIKLIQQSDYYPSWRKDINLSKISAKFSNKVVTVDLQKIDSKSFFLSITNKSAQPIVFGERPIVNGIELNSKDVVAWSMPLLNSQALLYELFFVEAITIMPQATRKLEINSEIFDYKGNILGVYYRNYKSGVIATLNINNWIFVKG